MAEEYELPKISAQTKAKLNAYGFQNQLYQGMKLPSYYIPRGQGFDTYTYLIMALGTAGAAVAKRHGSLASPFLAAVIAAPVMSILTKKQADFLWNSNFSKKHPSLVLQQYPILNQSYQQVLGEVNQQIQQKAALVRELQQQLARRQQQ